MVYILPLSNSDMLGSLAYLFDNVFVGTVVAFACVGVGYRGWKRLWKQREQRRESRERERLRRQFWGWE